MPIKKRASVQQKECVACGCCVKVCPRQAIHIEKGMFAWVDPNLCVGCSKCAVACPACVIDMMEVDK